MTPISTASAAHYRWGDSCDGWHLVQTQELSVIQERMPPGAMEVRHLHRVARQFFYVLSGVLSVEADGLSVSLTAGQGVEVAPGVAHQVANEGRDPVEFVVTSQPPSHGDREEPGTAAR